MHEGTPTRKHIHSLIDVLVTTSRFFISNRDINLYVFQFHTPRLHLDVFDISNLKCPSQTQYSPSCPVSQPCACPTVFYVSVNVNTINPVAQAQNLAITFDLSHSNSDLICPYILLVLPLKIYPKTDHSSSPPLLPPGLSNYRCLH